MHPFLDVARELATEAGGRLMELRLTTLHKERKADHSLVTNADHEADRIIRTGLRKAFPKHAVLTEESGLEGSAASEYVWVVDPLDGTKAYVNGSAGFSVMIGLLKAGAPFAGVVFDPWEGHLYEAVRGGGTCHTFEGKQVQVHVSKRTKWPDMPVITSTGFPQPLQKKLQALFPGPWLPPVNSVGVKVGFIARQLVDIYINHHSVHYWDTVAPQIILEEAGGTFSFLTGKPLAYGLTGNYHHAGPTLATNGKRHEEALEILRGAMPLKA